MILSGSFFLCIAVGIFMIAASILEVLNRRRIRRRTMDDSLNGMKRIKEAASQLSHLGNKQRAASRRAIAREILLDTEFIFSLVYECYRYDLPESHEVCHRARAVMREIRQLNWDLRKGLLLFRFRPRLAGHCERIMAAVQAHYAVWLSFIRFLQAAYPELYGDISIPDPP